MAGFLVSVRHNAFAIAVVVCGLAGAAAGLFVHAPRHLSAFALNSMLVYRGEVGFAVFLLLYVSVVFIRLAYHGLTPSVLGPAQFPTDVGASKDKLQPQRDDLAPVVEGLRGLSTVCETMRQVLEEVGDEVTNLDERVGNLERKQSGKDLYA